MMNRDQEIASLCGDIPAAVITLAGEIPCLEHPLAEQIFSYLRVSPGETITRDDMLFVLRSCLEYLEAHQPEQRN